MMGVKLVRTANGLRARLFWITRWAIKTKAAISQNKDACTHDKWLACYKDIGTIGMNIGQQLAIL